MNTFRKSIIGMKALSNIVRTIVGPTDKYHSAVKSGYWLSIVVKANLVYFKVEFDSIKTKAVLI